MEIKAVKKSNRGGYRTKKKLTSSQARFLSVLWDIYGGPGELEKLTGIPAQRFVNWKLQGKVSLKKAGYIAKKLEMSTCLLNYREIADLLWDYKGLPSWKEMVQEMDGIPEESVAYILKGKMP